MLLKKTLLLIIFFLFITGCTAPNEAVTPDETVVTATYQRITPGQAKEMLDTDSDIILLDVRTEQEFSEIRIPGAVLLPDTMVRGQASIMLPDKNTVILIYCRSGRRSENAAIELIDVGYKNVYDFGGIIDWDFETESD